MKKICVLIIMMLSNIAFASESIQIIVPYPVGGTTGSIALLLQKHLSTDLNSPVVINYIPGAGSAIGTQHFINLPSLKPALLLTTSAVVLNTFKNPVPYDANQLVPVAYLGNIPMVLVASKKSGIASFNQLIKLDPNKPITFGTTGVGSATQMATEILNLSLNKNILYIPYKGSGPTITDLLAGNIDCAVVYGVSIIPYVNSGDLVPLAVDSNNRLKDLLTVPTLKEIGSQYSFGNFSWFVLMANQSVDTKKIKQIQQLIVSTVNNKKTQSEFQAIGLITYPDKLLPGADFIAAERAKMARVISKVNLE